MALIVFVGMLIWFQTPIQPLKLILFMPLGLIIATFTSFGVGTLLAALNIKYRDFQYVIPFMIQVLLFMTPVIYPISILPSIWMKYVMAINPIYGAIELFRSGIIDKPIDVNLLTLSICSATFFFLVGIYYFRKTEAYFADLA